MTACPIAFYHNAKGEEETDNNDLEIFSGGPHKATYGNEPSYDICQL